MGTVEWIILAIVAFVVGAGAGFAMSSMGRRRDTAKVNEVEKELEDYRQQVSEHFEQAATHFQAIGEQYRALYTHMAEGSQALCKPAEAGSSLRFPHPKDVTPEAVQDEDPAVDASGDEADVRPEDVPPKSEAAQDDTANPETVEDPHADKTEEERPAVSSKDAEAMSPAGETDEDGKPRLYH